MTIYLHICIYINIDTLMFLYKTLHFMKWIILHNIPTYKDITMSLQGSLTSVHYLICLWFLFCPPPWSLMQALSWFQVSMVQMQHNKNWAPSLSPSTTFSLIFSVNGVRQCKYMGIILDFCVLTYSFHLHSLITNFKFYKVAWLII